MELILVRHGLPLRVETEDGSPADPPLSDEGRDQAQRAAQWLEREAIDRIYSSPMRRAQETAQPLASRLQLTPELEQGVAEFDQLSDSYVPLEELKQTDPERWRRLMASGWYGEFDPEVFRETVVTTMERIIADNAGKRVAIICHGGVINVWAAHVLDIARHLFFQPQYTSIHRFMASSRGHRSVVSLNESAHLITAR
ncbi:MAG: histidine phosphatase family protein [Myxococcales bacterium]|nr:histidine phosphatase family protein [Myxococcales bacterium]